MNERCEVLCNSYSVTRYWSTAREEGPNQGVDVYKVADCLTKVVSHVTHRVDFYVRLDAGYGLQSHQVSERARSTQTGIPFAIFVN